MSYINPDAPEHPDAKEPLPPSRAPAVTVPKLSEMKRNGEKIAMMTAYDYIFADLLDKNGVDVVLVGDSLGMVIQGHRSTLTVTVADLAYHVACASRGMKRGLLLADLPVLSYATLERALSSCEIMLRAGAHMMKLEGAGPILDVIHGLTERDVAVCAHLGLTPQSVHKLGGFKVQGRDERAAAQLLADAKAAEQAGAEMLVLECVPADVAANISQALQIPTIGIGAGAGCDGQVLVLQDALGLGPHRKPRFVKNFMNLADNPSGDVKGAVQAYVQAVKKQTFPGAEHVY
jgi:3-methyl-2-oxobutanoate hydroxymethyltransferase